MPAVRPKPSCPKKQRNCDLLSLATRSLAAVEYENPESAVYDVIVAAKYLAAALETWFTPGLNTGDN